MNADLEEQENELLALQSIFTSEEFIRNESKFAGEFRVSVELPAGFNVLLKNGETTRQYDVSFLPPLLLTFQLPDDYPSSSPPSFTLSCSWLTQSQLTSLSGQLTELYQATGGAVVLFSWVQFLREDTLKHLDISTVLELPSDSSDIPQTNQEKQEDEREAGEEKHTSNSGSPDLSVNLPSGDAVTNSNFRLYKNSESTENYQKDFSTDAEKWKFPEFVSVRQEVVNDIHPSKDQRYSGLCLTPSQKLLSNILIHDADQKRKVFAATLFDCSICFSSRFGSECELLDECGHIFCRVCLSDFCKAQITEGSVQGVTCLQPGCPATPTPAQVKCLVGEELFHRYDRLLLQSTLDRMPDITYCPRPSCSSAVVLEGSSHAALCSVCSFAFCVDCKKTNHGTSKCYEEPEMSEEMSEEALKSPPQTDVGMETLLEDYATGSKQRRNLLERRYGHKMLLYTLEKHLSTKWITGNTKPCPHCFCPIQKDGGCNHMYCSQCNQSFNWE